jgi:hypothetical protein
VQEDVASNRLSCPPAKAVITPVARFLEFRLHFIFPIPHYHHPPCSAALEKMLGDPTLPPSRVPFTTSNAESVRRQINIYTPLLRRTIFCTSLLRLLHPRLTFLYWKTAVRARKSEITHATLAFWAAY